MPKLRTVWVWGPGPDVRPGRRELHEALTAAVTAPAELYSQHLREAGVEAPRSEIRGRVEDAEFGRPSTPDIDRWWRWDEFPHGRVGAMVSTESFLTVVLIPNPDFVGLSAHDRADVALEFLHRAVLLQANAQGLPMAEFAAAADEARAAGLEFDWASRPKSSPDRRHKAALRGHIGLDGAGTATLVVVDRAGQQVVGSGAEPSTATVESFRRSSRNLRWTDRTTVEVDVEQPWPDMGLRRLSAKV